jgi:hypothetical protein
MKGQIPQDRDFRGALAKGRIPPQAYRNGQPDALLLYQAAGISCFETLAQARDAARRFRLGQFIAEIIIPADGCFIDVERTGPLDGHHTVWASSTYLISRVVSVQPV